MKTKDLSTNTILELLSFYNSTLTILNTNYLHIADNVPNNVLKAIATEKNKLYNEIERRENLNLS